MFEFAPIPYDNDFKLVEFTLGYPLAEPPAQLDGKVELDKLHHAAYASVFGALSVQREKAGGDADWFPDGNTITAIHDAHRRQRQYLRMHAGLQSLKDALIERPDNTLFDYQQDTLVQIADYLATNDYRASNSAGASIVLPTGSGKTRIIVRTVEAMKSKEDSREPVRIMVVAPTNAVVDELRGFNGKSGFGELAPHLNVGVQNTRNKEADREVVITTRASFLRMLENDPLAVRQFSAIVLDESHKFLGEQTFEELSQLDIPIIGFTATDIYTPEKQVKNLLPEELQRKSAREMIDDGRLSAVQTWICKTDEVIRYDPNREDFSPEELSKIGQLEHRRSIAEDIVTSLVADGRRGVIACNSISEADTLTEELASTYVQTENGQRRPIRIAAVHGKTKNARQTFADLQAGHLDAISIVDIDEGWDVPPASFLVNLRPTRSKVKAMQRAGRILRPYIDAQGNYVTAQLIDLLDVLDPVRGTDDDRPIKQGIVTGPQVLGESEYNVGKLLGAQLNRPRVDFSLGSFPPHLRHAIDMSHGVKIDKLQFFGMTANLRAGQKGELLSSISVAQGLGVTATRLNVLVAATGAFLREERYFDQKAVDLVAQRLIDRGEPIR